MSFLKATILLLVQHLILVMSENADPSVIIIGAGPAGISAATKLFKNNIRNIKILEAENRIGGRIHSVKFGDAIVDLGGEWYHGPEDIPIFDTIKELDLIELQDFSKIYYHSSGQSIDQDLANELMGAFLDIYNSDIKDAEGLTVGDYLEDKFTKVINQKYGDDPRKLSFARDFQDVVRKTTLLFKGTFSWDESAIETDYKAANSRGYHWKQYGFKALLDVLLERYPDPTKELPIEILFEKEVKRISWNGEANVECTDGSVYKADHIISTVSLGVLKNRYLELFEPELPEEKQNAIKELGISAVGKVFFQFPAKWWPDDFKSIDFFWTEEDKKDFLENQKDQAWLLDFVGLYPTPYNPNVLQTWFCGESVPKIELLPDEKIMNGVMLILNKFLGKHFQNISPPDALLRYDWYENSHFHGTYSYQTVESRKREVSGEIALSKPLQGKNGKTTLLFAGEATHPTYYGTVHGAMETGFREADRIINLYKK